MKKHFLLLLSFCAMSLMSAAAQDEINLHFSDGTVKTFKLADVDSINFTQSAEPLPDEPITDTFDATSLTGTASGQVTVMGGISADMDVNITTTADSVTSISANAKIMYVIPVIFDFNEMKLVWNEATQLFDYQLDNAKINVQGTAYDCKVVGTVSKDGKLTFNAASDEYVIDYQGTLPE